MNYKKNIDIILRLLSEAHPDAECELVHSTTFELLVATILSAQTTDKKVNEVTMRLFKEYNTPEKFLNLKQEELEIKFKEIGLYKNKSKNILSMCRTLIEEFNGEVPSTMDELISLAGVGRKTANVVMSNAYNIPSFAVDTHVFRVSNRIGIAKASDVVETEKQLMKIVPKDQWIKTHHTLIFHGRRICMARKPNCEECVIKEYCKFYVSN